MPNLTGVSASPFFRIGFCALKSRIAARPIVGALLQLGGDLLQQVLLHRLMVMGDVAPVFAVVIDFTHRQRIARQIAGDAIHDFFDGHHALRPAEAAVGGVGGDVGLAAVADDQHVLQKIGVVGMEHRAVDDRAREIERVTAVARQIDFHPVQQALVVETDVVANIKRVTFAGDQHVVAAVEAHFDRPAGKMRDDGTQAGRAARLGLLAAKAAAHAAHVDGHPVHRQIEHRGYQLLDFGRVLGR
ncbi:Uncharacterised protein [Serratia ficaria]|nr:Uncharacterised protein [Serratia ficaria]